MSNFLTESVRLEGSLQPPKKTVSPNLLNRKTVKNSRIYSDDNNFDIAEDNERSRILLLQKKISEGIIVPLPDKSLIEKIKDELSKFNKEQKANKAILDKYYDELYNKIDIRLDKNIKLQINYNCFKEFYDKNKEQMRDDFLTMKYRDRFEHILDNGCYMSDTELKNIANEIGSIKISENKHLASVMLYQCLQSLDTEDKYLFFNMDPEKSTIEKDQEVENYCIELPPLLLFKEAIQIKLSLDRLSILTHCFDNYILQYRSRTSNGGNKKKLKRGRKTRRLRKSKKYRNY